MVLNLRPVKFDDRAPNVCSRSSSQPSGTHNYPGDGKVVFTNRSTGVLICQCAMEKLWYTELNQMWFKTSILQTRGKSTTLTIAYFKNPNQY